MRSTVASGLLLLLVTASIAAQQNGVATRVSNSLDSKLVDPTCELKGGDFRVKSGKTYLKTGIEASEQANRTRSLRDGVRVLTESINGGQSSSPVAWYWLGRTYLQQGDLVGADTALARAEKLAPTCKTDIDSYRYRAWASLVNAGGTMLQNKQEDSAVVMYSAANIIYRGAPLAYVNLAQIYNSRAKADSAIYYFGLAAATEPSDTSQIKVRNQSMFNQGVLLYQANRNEEAIPVFEKYLVIVPTDATAKKALASAYRRAGQTEKAQALEKELIAAGPVAGAEGEGVSDSDLYDLGAQQFNDKNYKDAALTFGKVIEHNPYYRDALFNQANAYLALEDGANLAATAERLIQIEPLNEFDHSMRAQGYKFTKNTDKLVEAITVREGLPLNVEIDRLKVAGATASIVGKAKGREAKGADNKVIPARPITIVVEFLDQTGQVLATQETTIPALQPNAEQAILVEAKADGIKAWRYKVKA